MTDGQADMENPMHAFLQHFIAQLQQWISRVVWKDKCVSVSESLTHGCPPGSRFSFIDTKNVSILATANRCVCFVSPAF